MPQYMVTHKLPPKGFSREQFCQVSVATQQDPVVKCHQSYANLSEGKVFCFWEGPRSDPRSPRSWPRGESVNP